MTRQFIKYLAREASSSHARKDSILAIMNHKMQVASGEVDETEGNVLKKVRHTAGRRDRADATKNTRRIELGRILDGTVLCTSSGGRNRKIVIPKDADNMYMLKEEKTLFFPEGISTKEDWKSLTVQCWTIKGTKPDGVTVGDIYEMTPLGGYVCYYISSVNKDTTAEDSDSLPDIMGVPSREKNTSCYLIKKFNN